MLTNPDLMARIEAVALDDLDAALPLSRRLARDNGWSRGYARRVLEEYKRFVYLACALGREMTPSDEVDQAWHLHLCYTRHYWGPFTEALGRPLHHGPTAGGAREDARYRENYDATRAAYRAEFGIAPPIDIWPAPAIRFGAAPHMRRVNARDSIIISKTVVRRNGVAAGAAVASVGAAGYALAQEGGPPADGLGIGAIVLVAGLVVFLAGFRMLKQQATRRDGSGDGGGGYVPGAVGDDCADGDGAGGDGSGCGGSGCGGCGGG